MHGLMMDTPLLITEIMRFAERNFADCEIVSVTFDDPRHRTNLGEVFRRARKLANALQAAGVKQGDRVATLAWNDYRHLELYYAVSCMGAVLHTVNPRLFPEQLEFIINHAEDKLLFVDPTLLPALAPLAGKLPTVEKTIVMTSAQAMPAAVAGTLPDYESFIAGHADTFDWPELDERAASSLCYTSGTTGNPKGVLFSHRSTVLHGLRRHAGGRDGPLLPRHRPRRGADVPRQRVGPAVQRADGGRQARVPRPEDGRRGHADAADERGRRDAGGGGSDGVDDAARLPGPDRRQAPDAEAHGDRRLGRTDPDDPRFPRQAWRHGDPGLGHDGDEPARLGQHVATGAGSPAAGGADPAARQGGSRHLRHQR